MNKNIENKNNNLIEKTRKVEYEDELDLMGFKIPCYVLEDGTSILSNKGMQNALKIVDKDSKSLGGQMTRFLTTKSLQPFIFKGKQSAVFKPIVCRRKQGGIINGYEATVLADICDGILEARKHIELTSRQKIVAAQCEILLRAFAKTGIIALVHEATGYQEVREKTLQDILKAYVLEGIAEWKKTFQQDFYEQIYRLWEQPFTPKSLKKKPQFIGRLTNKLIYENMPEGVLEKIKEKTPKTKGGNWKYKFHQNLTPEVGKEHLKEVIYSVKTLASISKTKEEFLKLMERKYLRPFSDELEETDENNNGVAKTKKPLIGSVNRSFKLDFRSSNEMEEILKNTNEKYASRKKINASQLFRAMVHLVKSKPQEEIIEAIKETVF